MDTKEDIKKHLVELEDDDIKIQDTARWQLATIGQAAVPDLVHQLKTDKEPCRREAAKILGEIQDESAVHDLVQVLMDESIGVEWAASEALIKYGHSMIIPLLEGITHIMTRRASDNVLSMFCISWIRPTICLLN